MRKRMRRRSLMQMAGGTVLASSVFGTASASPRKEGGLRAYEQYCKGLVQDHGSVERQNAALANQGKVKTVGEGPETLDVATLYGSDDTLAAIEEKEFTDGTVVGQTVSSEDGERIEVVIDDRRFTMERSNVRRVLERRKQMADRRLNMSSSIRSNTEASSKEVRLDSKQASNELNHFNEEELAVPYTGGTYNDANWHHCNTASDAAVAGAGAGYAEAWGRWGVSFDNGMLANFQGSYNGAAWNVLATSELKLQFFIEDYDGNELGQTYAKYKSTFLGDYWQKETDYDENIFVRDPPTYFIVRMKGYSLAAAVGMSTTGVSAADPAGGHHQGYFEIDSINVEDR